MFSVQLFPTLVTLINKMFTIAIPYHDIFGLIRSFFVADKKNDDVCKQMLDKIMTQYDDVITNICFSYARDAAEFEDMRQDTLINIWRGAKCFRGDASLKTWVYRITLNTCSTYLRRRAYKFVSLEEIVFKPDTDTSDREDVEYLHYLISRLNSLDKSIILLRLENFSYDEIAEITSLKRNTIASRIHRIKETLIKLNKHNSI